MKQFMVAFLILASLNAYSKQAEKENLKKAENLNLNQIKNFVIHQDVVFVCKIEASTGYVYKDGKWQVTQFETGEKFLLRELLKDDPGFTHKDKTPYGVFDIGEKTPLLFCTANEEGTRVSCSGIGTLEFSTETSLFLRIEGIGPLSYADYLASNSGPKMMYGSCVFKREVNM